MTSKLNAGEIEISLNGETKYLKPTLQAMTSISRMHGGLGGARNMLAAQDFDTICNVIRHGLGLQDRDMRALSQSVFKTGLSADLIVPLIKFVGVLGNGGRPIDDGSEEEAGAEAGQGKETDS